MTKSKQAEVDDVILALQVFVQDIQDLISAIDRISIPRNEVMELRAKFKDLKGRLKDAAKVGIVDGTNRPLTHFESNFFQPAARNAIADCHVAVNTHPIKSDRLGRSTVDLLNIVDDLHNRNIGFKSLTEDL